MEFPAQTTHACRILRLLMVVLVALPSSAVAETLSFSVEADSVRYSLTVPDTAYLPQKTFPFAYTVKNLGHDAISFGFPSSRRLRLDLSVNGETVTPFPARAYFAMVVHRLLLRGESFTLTDHVSRIATVPDYGPYVPASGDTLRVSVRPDSRAYTVGTPLVTDSDLEVLKGRLGVVGTDAGYRIGDPEFDAVLDANDDGILNFQDVLVFAGRGLIPEAQQGVPGSAAFSFAVAIRSPDIDADGSVGFDDFLLLAAAFGTRSGGQAFDARADLNGNGRIEFDDFLKLVGHWSG